MKSSATPVTAFVLALAVACASPEPAPSPAVGRADVPSTIEPGEEPLETETLGAEEVKTLAPEKVPDAPAESRPCGWARAWSDPGAAHPLLAGVGGAPSPARLHDAAIRVPVREPKPQGEIVVELVIRSDGSVSEAKVLRSTTPPWPEAEDAVLESVRGWRYEPPAFQGTPVAICSTVLIQP